MFISDLLRNLGRARGCNVLPATCRYVFTVLPSPVAQTCSLLYRRVALCRTPGKPGVGDRSDALPITNRRYGRLKIRATVNTYGCRRSGEAASSLSGGLKARDITAWAGASVASGGPGNRCPKIPPRPERPKQNNCIISIKLQRSCCLISLCKNGAIR